MLTRNVHYQSQPGLVLLNTNAHKAVVEFPLDVHEITIDTEDGERSEWVADKVYSIKTVNVPNLKEKVEERYSDWLALAKEPEPIETTIEDLVDAINTLTELVIGE